MRNFVTDESWRAANRAVAHIDADNIRAAERRGAMAAVKLVWKHTSWMGRFLALAIAAALAYAGDSLLTGARNALNAFLDGGPG